MARFTLIADDYAMTAGVSRGIIRLLEHGRISGAGAMTNRPHWKGWSNAFRGFAGAADLGVHLNLTLGKPLTSMPRFAPAQTFPTIGDITKGGLSLRLPIEELEGEIEAQLDAYEDAMDARPDFIDGHQHVHGLPGVRRAFFNVMTKRYAKGTRPWLRDSSDSLRNVVRRGRNMQKALAVAGLTSGMETAASKAGFLTNDTFAGFSSFDPKQDFATDFASYLINPGARHLVMCHPGEVDDELRGLDPVVETRPQELAFLLSDQALEIASAAGMRLARLRPLAS
ncbi:MAG: ChbG/HpnK family deacetylase [Beijerinckiaceae bacterium]